MRIDLKISKDKGINKSKSNDNPNSMKELLKPERKQANRATEMPKRKNFKNTELQHQRFAGAEK